MWLVCSLSVPDCFLARPYHHLPVIKTVPVIFDEALALKEAGAHQALLFTSKEAARYCLSLLQKLKPGKTVFCVGPQTQKMVHSYYQGETRVPSTFDQEGLCALLGSTHSLFYPRAFSVRPILSAYCQDHKIKLTELICYQTQTNPVLMPQGTFKGYFFGSPSCLKAYLELFGPPPYLPILVQGLVTQKAALELLGSSYQVQVLKGACERTVSC